MSIIRGEIVREMTILSASGELITAQKEEFVDLVEEECQKAFQKGEEAGQKLGYYKAMEESKVFLNLLQTMSRKILEQKHRLLDQIKPEIIEFAMTVCERIIRKELSQPHVFARLIHSLLNAAIPSLDRDALQIVLSPDDLVLLDKREIEGIRFLSDPLMQRGDCRIETPTGLLHYEISRELADLQAKVLQV